MKVIAVDGKILLANGKAVKPPAGGGGALSFTSQAVGRIPTYQVGHANSEFTINTNMFSATAVGSLQEA